MQYILILTDFNMPIMDGLTCTRQIRQMLSDQGRDRSDQPTIIGLSGHVEEHI